MTQAPIRVGIFGYGNLGRGVELAVAQQPDLELVGVFTRRDPASLTPALDATQVFAASAVGEHEDRIDVMILCGGSKSDLPEQGPALAARFNTIDSFDTHARIPEYFDAVDAAARAAGRTAIISVGWDPGLFSLARLQGEVVLAQGETATFWGRGLSQGHSDAIRGVPGVANGVQYTVPSPEAVEAFRAGEGASLTTRDKHARECFVVLEADADADAVREAIVTMPHYFDQYDTTVHVISADELARDHAAMPHGGFVLRRGVTGSGAVQNVQFSLELASNPEFTASVLVAYARAAHRLNAAGDTGAKSVFDVAPGLLSPKDPAELRAELL